MKAHTDREGKKLRDVGLNVNDWLTDAEQLIHKGQEDRKDAADDPGADGRAGHIRVVPVIDDRAHLGVGTVVGDEGSLELHLVDKLGVLLWILEDILIL